MFDLAVCYETGSGVVRDLEKAFILFKKSAKYGDMNAIFEVGRMMYYGIGTAKDQAKAQPWLERAEKIRGVEALSA